MMELVLRKLLLFLRKLVAFSRERWDLSTRRLWYIFAFIGSRILPQRPKKGDETRRNIEHRPTKPSTTVICTSRFPPLAPTITPTASGGDSPTTHNSYASSSQHPEWHPLLQHPYRHGSPSNLDGAEAAGWGYPSAHPPPRHSTPTPSVRAPSIAGSVASGAGPVTPHVYRVPRPITRPLGPAAQVRMHTVPSTHSVPTELSQPESLGRTLRPTTLIGRYEKHTAVVIENVVHSHVFSPVTTQFTRDPAPDDWVPLSHPEGALYWVHRTKPIYTDTDMCDPDLRREIEKFIEDINALRDSSPPLPEDWELVLELEMGFGTDGPSCSYYFVSHSTRCLFWLHEFDLESALDGLSGVTEVTHIHLALQARYWIHWEMFPHNREVPEELFRELSGIILHLGIGCMTSHNSTTTYSEPELNKLLGYVRDIKQVGGNYGFSACVVGHLMSRFVYSRYVNFHGQKGARLTSDQSIYGFQRRRTYLIKIMSILFFNAPELHLRGLEFVYTDFSISRHRWVHFITKLQSDWTEFTLYGAVLLNANVAFLAIPSVDPGNHTRTPAQLASYFSIITSIGSVVAGLLLLQQHRTKPQNSAEENDNYFRRHYHVSLGFEPLAILYSLSYSFLLWATISFLAAIGLETLLHNDELWTRLPVGTLLGVMVLLISWCVWITLEAGANFSLLAALKDGLVGFARCLRLSPSRPSSDERIVGGGGGQV